MQYAAVVGSSTQLDGAIWCAALLCIFTYTYTYTFMAQFQQSISYISVHLRPVGDRRLGRESADKLSPTAKHDRQTMTSAALCHEMEASSKVAAQSRTDP